MVTDRGSPVGAPVSGVIDDRGGVLGLSSGFFLQVPPGAVAGATTFTVQYLSTGLPGALASFRVSAAPDELLAPVAVGFVVDSVVRHEVDLVYMVAQQQNGTWRLEEDVRVDYTGGDVWVSTTRLGDWSVVHGVQMHPEHAEVALGDSARFEITRCVVGYEGTAYVSECRPIREGERVPQPRRGGFDMFIAPDGWETVPPGPEYGLLRGTGTGVTYVAPPAMPEFSVMPVTIQASVRTSQGLTTALVSYARLLQP